MFSKACEYAIRSTIFIATKSLEGERANLKEISKEIDSPIAFTAKILQELVRNNIIESQKGPSGGFMIQTDQLSEIKLKHIVLAIDGDSILNECSLGMRECSEIFPCPVHSQFKIIRNGIKEMLETTDLVQLCKGLKSGMTFLKLEQIKDIKPDQD
jgi:Rrf2 family protein